MLNWRSFLLLLLVFLPASVMRAAPDNLVINEIRTDQPGTDIDEYVELRGDPNTPLDGLAYVVIGDGALAAGSGVVEAVIDLDGQSLDEEGFFVAAEDSFSLGSADLVTTLNFENEDNVTHLLVEAFTGTLDDDLDTDDDGTLDVEPWTAVVDSVALIQNDTLGDEVYSSTRIGPNNGAAPMHVYLGEAGWRIGQSDPVGGNDTPGESNVQLPPVTDGTCGDPAVLLHAVQGSDDTSPLFGQIVEVEAIVVGDFQAGLDGFHIQEEASEWDANDLTSQGVFVYYPGAPEVNVGEIVRIQGTVSEFRGETQISSVTGIRTDCGTATPQVTTLTFPLGDLEAYEGMLVTSDAALTVTDTYNLGAFGEVTLSAIGAQITGTENHAPGQPAVDSEAANAANRILVDDGSNEDVNLNPVPYVNRENGQPTTVRRGSAVQGFTGVIGYGFGAYRLQPTQPIEVTVYAPRPTEPTVGGEIVVANLNVFNYFTTIDDGSNGARGADSEAELERQQAKLIAALTTLDADVIALQELENNGTAIATLVEAINAETGRPYAAIETGIIGTDAITVGLIYDTSTLTPIGTTAMLTTGPFDGLSRPPVAQAFADEAGEVFTVVVNHFKSKGCTDATGDDTDQDDGQGCYNATRVESAAALLAWLASTPTGIDDPDVLIIGDLNSYTLEDPITTLTTGAYTNLLAEIPVEERYTYTFNGEQGVLDHALASPSLTAQVAGAAIWHINADEPRTLDYNDAIADSSTFPFFDDINADPTLYQPDAYRSSDHDPVLIGFNLDTPPPSVDVPNGSFEQDLEEWVIQSTGGRRDGRFAFVGAPNGDYILLLDGSGGVEGAEQTFPYTGTQGDEVTLTFITGGRNTSENGFIGGQLILLAADGTVIDRCTAIVPERAATFGPLTLTCTIPAASADYTSIRLRLGGVKVTAGLYGFDDVRIAVEQAATGR